MKLTNTGGHITWIFFQAKVGLEVDFDVCRPKSEEDKRRRKRRRRKTRRRQSKKEYTKE